MAQSGNGADIGAVYSVLTEISGRLDNHERKLDDLAAGVVDLRAAVRDYHTTVSGHGMLYGELEQRIRRIERHLKLESSGG